MVKKILAEICEHLKIKNNRELAKHLGVRDTTLYSWIKHDKITDTGIILAKHPEINDEWLRTGKGPMFCLDGVTREQTYDYQEKLEETEKTGQKFKELCAKNFEVIFDFIADEYGMDAAGIEDFKDEFKFRFTEYRLWREKKRAGRDHQDRDGTELQEANSK